MLPLITVGRAQAAEDDVCCNDRSLLILAFLFIQSWLSKNKHRSLVFGQQGPSSITRPSTPVELFSQWSPRNKARVPHKN